MTYQQALDFMYAQLPFFQKTGSRAYKPGFENILQLCAAVGNPQEKIKAVHIAGTNGKGSSAHMLAAVLQTAGYKTGLYTSPHLKAFTERIKIDGAEIPEIFIANWIQQQKEKIEEIEPSFFEVTVALAFDFFAQNKVDIAIIETGLGGRLDATNIIHPLLSLITNIGFDHMHILGNTLPKIAAEKAGIIKKDTPVVISEYQEEVAQVFREKAKVENAPLSFAVDFFDIQLTDNGMDILKLGVPFLSKQRLSLLGDHQIKNLKGVLVTLQLLETQGFYVEKEHLQDALANIQKLTGLKGRWQILEQEPLIVCDVAHNASGMGYIAEELKKTKYKHLHVVFGMLKEKEAFELLKFFPKNATFYLCQPTNARALPVNELEKAVFKMGLNFIAHKSVHEAFRAAKKNAASEDMIFVGGSTFVVAEVI